MNKFALLRMVLHNLGIDTGRIALEWVSAAEAPRFVQAITDFTNRIREIGPLGKHEGLDREALLPKIKAAKTALEGMKLRMAFAKQAKQIKKEGTYGELPTQEKLAKMLMDAMDSKGFVKE
jgi:F420-non-reducing hydrogenase iron-sulfur subunit